MPAAASRFSPPPATCGNGSRIAVTTRLNASGDNRVGAGRRFALMAAGLERDIHRRALRPLARRRQRMDLGVRPAELLVPTLADHLAILHDDAADHRVRLDKALAAAGQRRRGATSTES